MNLPDLDTVIMPIILLLCLCVGYVIKVTPIFDKISNKYIPFVVAILGAVLGVVVSGFSLESITYGMFSGLASTGLNQAFQKAIGALNKEEEK
ncbi:phage holin family protein [Enterococcus sp. AZ102]|uniref:phage holin family protein n=1 Tax=Enterococcus sp. AZ102 TaxID=2774865 RepID=UPI003F20FE33